MELCLFCTNPSISWHGNTYCITGPLWRKSGGFPSQNSNGVELMFSLLLASKSWWKIIWDIMILMWCPCYEKGVLHSTLPGLNSRHFTYNIFRCIFVNQKIWILIEILQEFVDKGSIDNNTALVLIMVWCWIGNKPLFEKYWPDSLPHICGNRRRWVNGYFGQCHLTWNRYEKIIHCRRVS